MYVSLMFYGTYPRNTHTINLYLLCIITNMIPEQDPQDEDLKRERKQASQIALFLGGVTLVIGAILCLIYIIKFKPWKISSILQP